MNKVQPIRDYSLILKLKAYLKAQNPRDYFLFLLGTNTASRIADILPLTVSSVRSPYIELKERKTGKTKRYLVNDEFKAEIRAYTKDMNPDDLLFPSRKGKGAKPLSRVQAWRIMKEAATAVGIVENIGTHTLRKTFGYWHYKKFKDVALLQQLLNHSSQRETLIYIGIAQDEIDDTLKDFFI